MSPEDQERLQFVIDHLHGLDINLGVIAGQVDKLPISLPNAPPRFTVARDAIRAVLADALLARELEREEG